MHLVSYRSEIADTSEFLTGRVEFLSVRLRSPLIRLPGTFSPVVRKGRGEGG